MSTLPKTRQELRNWCLRKLGEPVIEVNLDDDQIEDRISEALDIFNRYHYDGVEQVLLKHKITASTMAFDVALSGDINYGEILTGSTSGATACFIDQADDNLSLRFESVEGTFVDGEVVTSSATGITATLAASESVTLGDIDNGYIDIGDDILAVYNVYPLSGGNSGFGRIFGNAVLHQHSFVYFNDLSHIGGSALITYDMYKRHMALIEFEFHGITKIRFNEKTNKLYLDIDWKKDLVDDYVLVEANKILDPKDAPEVYCDYFVREYATALLKEQWAQNLSKYEGIELPGGVTLNAEKMKIEARKRIEELEERLEKEWQDPSLFFVG